MTVRSVFACVALTLAASAVSSVPAAGREAGHANEAENRQAAVRDAEERLAVLQLPPGASSNASPPAGADPELNRSPAEPETPNLIDLHGWWVVPGSPSEALAWVRAHLPPGSSATLSGSGGNARTGAEFQFAGLTWPQLGESVTSRELLVSVSAIGGGETALRADSQAVWIVPHASSERIPTASRVLEVGWYRPGGPRRVATTESARFIAGVETLIDGLPVAQPGVINCPFEPADPATVTLRFLGRRGGPPLAEAIQALPAGGVCNGMSLTIRGKHQPALLGAAPVVRRLRGLKATRAGS